jgi:cell division protein FtsQ
VKIINKHKIKKIFGVAIWMVTGAGCVALLAAAVRNDEVRHCTDIVISISGVSNNFFIDQNDIRKIISDHGGDHVVGQPISTFNLRAMELALKKDIWVKNAELYFDKNECLQVIVEEREPIARIFTRGGSTYYIDNSLMMLPLSDKFSARLPVFTDFPSEARVLSRADSALLGDVKKISLLIQEDPFLMAMIEQVAITPSREFEMYPKLGDQVIQFGDATEPDEKFRKLRLFYKKVLPSTGLSKYSKISLKYNRQVVAKIKGKDDVSEDSLRTIQIMQLIVANAEKMSGDSVQRFALDSDKNTADSSIIQQSIQRDEIINELWPNKAENNNQKMVKSSLISYPKQSKTTNPSPLKKQSPKPVSQKPKVVMPKKTTEN